MVNNFKLIILSLFSILLVACSGDDDDNNDDTTPARPASVLQVIQESPVHETLEAAVGVAGLGDTLSDANSQFTVFAPTDDAFAALGADAVQALIDNPAALTDVLLYHVIGDTVTSTNLSSNGAGLAATLGGNVNVAFENGEVYINFARVTAVDIRTDNGVVHVIDAVLLEPDLTPSDMNIVETAVANGSFETLVAALQATGLDSTLENADGSFTVFAPTDAAFDMLPTGVVSALLNDTDALSAVLLQHVISGAQVDSVTALSLDGAMAETAGGAMIGIDVDFSGEIISVGGSNVIIKDIVTSNGIIHVIDAVIVGDLDVPQPSIMDLVNEDARFTTLKAALEATALDVVLADLDTNYTVFAPTDDAFAALPEGTVAALLADTDTLMDILLYHVIGGQTVLADAAIGIAQGDMSKVATANGDEIALSFVDPNLFINTSTVIVPNVMASNGVVHALDQVLMPPAERGTPTMNIAETAIAAGNFTTLVGALTETGLVPTLSNEDMTFTVFAPTDAAFALLDQEALAGLLGEDHAALEQILLQHVIVGAEVDSVTAFTLNGTSVETASSVDGSDVTIEVVDGVLEIQGSAISTYDIYTTNGIIHVIDAVITETLSL